MTQYESLFNYAFSSANRGYRPSVVERPHGDSRTDHSKRFAHIAIKYNLTSAPEHVRSLFWGLFEEARHTAHGAGLPAPDPVECCLRVLDYPPGAGSEAHTDFNLFTLNVWRSPAGGLLVPTNHRAGRVHFGELAPMFGGPEATWHAVSPLPVPQRSIVFFVLPSRAERLPDGRTVGEWLAGRLARSRATR